MVCYEPCINLCGMAPLVAVPHTTMCVGVDSFTEGIRGSAHEVLISPYVCGEATPVILHGIGAKVTPVIL